MPALCKPGRRTLTAFSCEKLTVLRCYGNGDLVEGRVDNVRGLNLGRALDKSCHRLQHLRISIGVVGFGIGFVFPQTDGGDINSTVTSKCDFVLETPLLTKQGEDIVLKCARVIGKSIGFQMKRDIACKHCNLLRLGLLRKRTSDGLT